MTTPTSYQSLFSPSIQDLPNGLFNSLLDEIAKSPTLVRACDELTFH